MSESSTARTIVVTGGGSGIGRAVARELASSGARVIVVGRSLQSLEETALDLPSIEAFVGDVRDDAWLAELDRRTDGVDVLVNNAASFAAYGPISEVPVGEFDDCHATIVRGSFLAARHVMPGMKERGFGRIVNVGSVVAGQGSAVQAAYTSAKAALVGLTRSLALEGAPHGVTCNLVEPGLIATARTEGVLSPEIFESLVAATPVGRAGTPEEVARAIAFLASDAASYVTGVTLPVSGGLGLGL